jgi:hypothetical protein
VRSPFGRGPFQGHLSTRFQINGNVMDIRGLSERTESCYF